MRPAFCLAALGALAACSPSSDTTTALTSENKAASPVAAEPAPGQTAQPMATPNAPPKPGDTKTFKDWTIACDNILFCTMASLGPVNGDFPRVTIAAVRAAGPTGAWRLSLQVNQGDPGDARPAGIAVDGKPVGGAVDAKITGQPAAAIVAAMANGGALQVRDAKGATIETVSLAGAAAALRYIDAAQGRVGTVTAVVAKGAKPASAVPAPPDIPMIAAIKPGGTPAKLSSAQIAEMRKSGGCEGDSFAASQAPDSHPLGGGKTLVLVPCSTGAYNLSSAMFVVSDGGVAPAKVDAPAGFDFSANETPAPVPAVVNGEFKDGVLASYAKGRGLGDCGVEQQFVWDGDRFRLSEQSGMGECRGNPNYMTTWQAHVLRR